jgi:WD40 repeat protein
MARRALRLPDTAWKRPLAVDFCGAPSNFPRSRIQSARVEGCWDRKNILSAKHPRRLLLRKPMLRVKLFAGLTLVTLAIADAEWTQAQTGLPPGARVRLGTLNFHAGDRVASLAFSPDCETILWQGVDYTVRHWDLSTAKELNRFTGDDWGDGPQQFSIFHVVDNNSLLHTTANGLAVLDLKTGKERLVTELARGKPSWLSPDGKRVVTYRTRGSWSKRTAAATFTLWNLERAEKIREFTRQFKDAPAKADAGAQLAAVAFTPDGRTIATSWIYLSHGPMLTYRVGQVVSLWDVANGKERSLDAEAAYHLHFLDEGKTLACADGRGAGGARSTSDLNHGTMEIWDVAAGKKLHKFQSSVDWSGPLAFSPDGKLFASGGGNEDDAVYIWRTATGQQVKKFAGHRKKVLCLAFSPDGRMLASGSEDTFYSDPQKIAESILVWEVLGLR